MVLPFSRALLLSTSVAALYASGLTAYAVGSNEPEFVADFAGVLNSGTEYYRSGGSDTTFSSVFTHSGLVAPATMTDSDGVLKWAPHNLLLQSNDFNTTWGKNQLTGVTSNSTGTLDPDGTNTADLIIPNGTNDASHGVFVLSRPVTSGSTYEVAIYAKAGGYDGINIIVDAVSGKQAGFNLTAGTVDGSSGLVSSSIVADNNGFYKCSVVAAATDSAWDIRIFVGPASNINPDGRFAAYAGDTTSGVYVFGAHWFRSDLGGMVNNPDRGDSYVPTTTAARFLPRRNHYLYNGTSYDNAGILIESAGATNIIATSNTLDSSGNFNELNGTSTKNQTGPDGVSNSAWRFVDNNAGGTVLMYLTGDFTVATSTQYTFSVYAKADQLSDILLQGRNFTTPANGGVFFNLSSGTVGTQSTGYTGRIENVGSGWYRCSMSFTTDAADTSGTLRIYAANPSESATVDSDGTSSILLYGAQFEAGSVPTSYIPTSGSTVTRAAETLTVAGATFDAKQSGTIHVGFEWSYPGIDTNASVLVVAGSGSDLLFTSFAANQFSLQASAVNATVTGLSAGTTNVVGRWDSSVAEHALCVNGGSVVSSGPNATYTLPAHDAAFGDSSVGQYRTYRILRHWEAVELTDAQMQSASS